MSLPGGEWIADLLREETPGTQPDWPRLVEHIRHTAEILLRRYDLQWIDADDIAQDVLVRLFASGAHERWQESESVDGYLFVMIRNRIFDELRRERLRSREAVAALETLDVAPVRHELSLEQQIAIDQILDELSPDEYALIRLRFWEDRSIKDIAEELGLTYSAASVRLFRLLRKLRERLES